MRLTMVEPMIWRIQMTRIKKKETNGQVRGYYGIGTSEMKLILIENTIHKERETAVHYHTRQGRMADLLDEISSRQKVSGKG